MKAKDGSESKERASPKESPLVLFLLVHFLSKGIPTRSVRPGSHRVLHPRQRHLGVKTLSPSRLARSDDFTDDLLPGLMNSPIRTEDD